MISSCASRWATAVLLSFLLCTAATGGEARQDAGQTWSSGTAYTLPVGRMEVGIFQPLRYGLSTSLEFSIHPLVTFLMPNLSVKWSHRSFNGFQVSTNHSLYYPTPLLRTVAREGTGGLISPEFRIPNMVAINTEVLASKFIAKDQVLTGKLGLALAAKSATLDRRTTIDLPLIFPRMNVFYHGYSLRGGTNLQGRMFRRWHYRADAEIFITPKAEENFAFEQLGLLLWQKSARFQFCFGYKLVYGEYPFGSQWHLLAPLVDLQWGWRVK